MPEASDRCRLYPLELQADELGDVTKVPIKRYGQHMHLLLAGRDVARVHVADL